MNPNRKLLVQLFALPVMCISMYFLALGFISCAGNVATALTTPKTPLQWVQTYNAALAIGNDAFAKEVIQLQKAGTITAAQAGPLLVVAGKIAATSQQIRVITTNGQPFAVQAQAISAALTTLGAAQQLNSVGVTNTQLQTLIQSVLATVTLIEGQVKQ